MLDVLASGRTRAGTMDPLSSHTKQIRRLEFAWDGWANIKKFLQVDSGPLPLLRTLTVNGTVEGSREDRDTIDLPNPPLLSTPSIYFHSDLYRPPFHSSITSPCLIALDGSAKRELPSFATPQLPRYFPNVADSTHKVHWMHSP